MTVIRLPASVTTSGPEGTSWKGHLPCHPPTSGASRVAGCTPPLGALYILALLEAGDRERACEAVRFAVGAVAEDPGVMDATPSELWATLAGTIQNFGGWNETEGAAPAALRTAALSNDQRAIMALVGSGLAARDVAAILGIRVGAAKRSFSAGVRALGAALAELETTENRGWNGPAGLTETTAGSRAKHPGRHLRLVSSTPTDPPG